jgi:tRNA (guanine-N7-)-methyltransferase
MFSSRRETIAREAEVVPSNSFAPLDLVAIYGRSAPLEVDLGCGEGSFLAAIAAEKPGSNVLGIERQMGRVRSACRKIERQGLANARILHAEISYAVVEMLPEGSVTVFHLMFPDPWPKRRHAPRRLVNDVFFKAISRALVPDGVLRLATDHLDYFNDIGRLAARSTGFTVDQPTGDTTAASKFEKMFLRQGTQIHRLWLRKVSPVT